jgi:putative aldouronate transport system permease protein
MVNRNKGNFISIFLKYKYLYILIIPSILFTLVIQYATWFGVVTAFQHFDIVKGFFNSKFVGFDNFIQIFETPKFLFAIKNTILYSSVNLFCGFPFPIILAILFNEMRTGFFKRFTQTVSYLPHFLSWVSVITMFYAFFSLEGGFNDFRTLIYGADIERINILTNANYFLPIIFLSNLWKNVGWNTVIFLATITGISPTLYEAAKVDGCGKLRQIFHVTLPGIANTVVIVFIISIGGLLNSNFEQVFGFQNVYIQEQTEVISTLVYRQGILGGNYSLATAFGLAQGIVSFILVFCANKISKKVSGIGLW